MYERARKGLTANGVKEEPLGNTKDAYSELKDIFPSLQKYKDEHNADNLHKLMIEISEFCESVYASTINEAERKIYRYFIQKLNK